MVSPTLRRQLLLHFDPFRSRRSARSTWSYDEDLRFHEALWLLPPDCSWLDVANYIGTKTRTQTLSRALSLQRRYARADSNRQRTLVMAASEPIPALLSSRAVYRDLPGMFSTTQPVHDHDQAPTAPSITRMVIPQDVWAAQWCSIQAPSPLELQLDHAMGGTQVYQTPILNTTDETDETAILHDAHPELSAMSNSHLFNASNELENETDNQGQVFQVNAAIVQEVVNGIDMATQEMLSDEAWWNELISLIPNNIELVDFIGDSLETISP